MTKPTSLIINSPYEVPLQHWQQARDGSLTLTPERQRSCRIFWLSMPSNLFYSF